MSSLLKWIVIALVLFALGAWIVTVAKSCNAAKDPLLKNPITENIGETVKDGIGDAQANLDDLYDKTAGGMTDLKKEAIAAKDKAAMEAKDLSGKVFGSESEEDEAIVKEREAQAKADQLAAKGNSSSSASTTKKSSGNSQNEKYLVVTGSYLSEVNAKAALKQLKKAGYSGAEIVEFDFSQYYTVVARRYNRLSQATALKNKLQNKLGTEVYVHEKRVGKQ